MTSIQQLADFVQELGDRVDEKQERFVVEAIVSWDAVHLTITDLKTGHIWTPESVSLYSVDSLFRNQEHIAEAMLSWATREEERER